MALPTVKSFADCIDYSRTVAPYIPQLTGLPQHLLQTWTDVDSLKQLYLSTNPLVSAVAFSIAICPIFLIVSEINRNYSQVDRCWSLLPTVYNIHYAVYAHLKGIPTERLDLIMAVSIIWSSRLTFNYWRKGGYNIGSEDYRWEILRDYIPPFWFFVFNVLFIATAQSLLLVSITFPTYALLLESRVEGSLQIFDYVFGFGILGCVLGSFIADQQQWNYQIAKQDYRKTAKVSSGFKRQDLDRGFLASGLWSHSRHPNFAFEQSVWVGLYFWSCQAPQTVFNWTGVGAVCYLFLFQASTWFTELVTSRKYPEYKIYQQKVGMFVPTGPLLKSTDELRISSDANGKKIK